MTYEAGLGHGSLRNIGPLMRPACVLEVRK